jgi:predicted methyltransferase
MKPLSIGLTFVLILTGCEQPAAEPEAEVAPVIDRAIYANAVANPARPAADLERDADRKPADVLEFFGIGPNMVVLDMFSGGGYYTEIMATVVGEQGRVIAHSSKPYLVYVGEEFEMRHADNRLSNVDVLMAENNELALETDTLDAVTMVLSYHDIYHVNLDIGWLQFDRPKLLAELHKGLKPGGIFGIVDHSARAGAPAEIGNTLHRIDPAIVIEQMQSAGFELEARSDLLRNPDDDPDKIVFAPEIRGKTDRFILLFRKPM